MAVDGREPLAEHRSLLALLFSLSIIGRSDRFLREEPTPHLAIVNFRSLQRREAYFVARWLEECQPDVLPSAHWTIQVARSSRLPLLDLPTGLGYYNMRLSMVSE